MTELSPLSTAKNCRTIRVSDCAEILGIGRSSAYALAREAEKAGAPFSVIRVGSSLLISKKSFDKFLNENGL